MSRDAQGVGPSQLLVVGLDGVVVRGATSGRRVAELLGAEVQAACARQAASRAAEVVRDLLGQPWLVTRADTEVWLAPLGPSTTPHVTTLLRQLSASASPAEFAAEVTRLAAELAGGPALLELREAGTTTALAAAPSGTPRQPVLEPGPAPAGPVHVAPDAPLSARCGGAGRRGLLVPIGAGERDGALLVFASGDRAPDPAPFAALGAVLGVALTLWRARQACAELSERFRLVAEATQHLVYDWDVAAGRLTWNARLTEVFGHALAPEHETIEWWRARVHPEDRARVSLSLERAMSEGAHFWTSEYRFERADGRYAWVFDRSALVYDAHRRATRMLGVMEDISRDRERDSTYALAARLAAVGTLAGGVAHEINNPLAWVTSNLGFVVEALQRLARHDENEAFEELLDALDDARAGAARIAQIVGDLRTFARADADTSRPVSMTRVAEAALALATNELRHRGRVTKALAEVPRVQANEARLSQCIVNLLLNAAWSLSQAPAGLGEVRVSTRCDGPDVVLEVADNGPGISPEVLPRIFDPFFTTKPQGEGLGLGLAVTHSIVRGMGGHIEVESAPGRGATFRLRLPALPPEPAPRSAASALAAPARRAVVMVIDDEPSILSGIERSLGDRHEVHRFDDSSAAIAALGTLSPDLVLCDLMMPGLPGSDVYEAVARSRPELLDRFVYMTGGAFTASAQAFLERTRVPVIDKPFTPQQLRELVTEQVRRLDGQKSQ